MADFKRVRVPHLPKEVIFEILLRIPAEILYSVMRIVCKDWYDIIRDHWFISSHLLRPSTCLIVKSYTYTEYDVRYVDCGGGEIKLKRGNLPWRTNVVIASCNGLLLLDARIIDGIHYYVANPVTKKLLVLPASTRTGFHASGFGYAASIGAYKVVSVWRETLTEQTLYVRRILVLTLGVDKSWRCIGTDESFHNLCRPFQLSIKGFIYFVPASFDTVVALDVDTELFHSFCIPKGLNKPSCVPWGDYLAVVDTRNGPICKVWVAREVKRAGEEWTRLPDIDLGPCYFSYHLSSLAGWLKEAELVFLRSNDRLFKDWYVCDIKTGAISALEIGQFYGRLLPFVPSLVSI